MSAPPVGFSHDCTFCGQGMHWNWFGGFWMCGSCGTLKKEELPEMSNVKHSNPVVGHISFGPGMGEPRPSIDVPSLMRSAGFKEGRAAGLEEAAKFLEEHARGYEASAVGVGNRDATERRTTGHVLREKAHGLRQRAIDEAVASLKPPTAEATSGLPPGDQQATAAKVPCSHSWGPSIGPRGGVGDWRCYKCGAAPP